jgi:hypothetical protein
MIDEQPGSKVQTRYILGLEDFIKTISDEADSFFSTDFPPDPEKKPQQRPVLWFRGHEDQSYSLLPKLYRIVLDQCKQKDDETKQDWHRRIWDQISNDEKELIEEFKLRNYHQIGDHYPENDFLWLCLMQHYGTAGRLLDWSETAMAAVFFALERYFVSAKPSDHPLPCIWVLKPALLNYCSAKNNDYRKIADSDVVNDLIRKNGKYKIQSLLTPSRQRSEPREDLLDPKSYFLPLKGHPRKKPRSGNSSLAADIGQHHQAVYSPYNNERIKVQSGAFTIFPLLPNEPCEPLKSYYLENLPDSDQFLYKIILVRPEHISNQLKRMGVKRSLYYPEMPNVSVDIETKILLDGKKR